MDDWLYIGLGESVGEARTSLWAIILNLNFTEKRNGINFLLLYNYIDFMYVLYLKKKNDIRGVYFI